MPSVFSAIYCSSYKHNLVHAVHNLFTRISSVLRFTKEKEDVNVESVSAVIEV